MTTRLRRGKMHYFRSNESTKFNFPGFYCIFLCQFVTLVLGSICLHCSEHSRHWFFKGRMIVDGEAKEESLFQMVSNTQRSSNQNNVLKFCDNSRLGWPICLASCFVHFRIRFSVSSSFVHIFRIFIFSDFHPSL